MQYCVYKSYYYVYVTFVNGVAVVEVDKKEGKKYEIVVREKYVYSVLCNSP